MAVNWHCDDTVAHKKAFEAALVSGEFNPKTREWDEYADLRMALICALKMTGFPPGDECAITEDNWKKVFQRLYILEQTSHPFRIFNGGKQSAFFSAPEVHSMIGMRVSAGNKSDAEFMNHILRNLQDRAEKQIIDCNLD